jgi:hypothetical protein
MLQMVRRFTPLIALIGLLVVAEPLLHSHPLESCGSSLAGSTACAVCAASVGHLPTTVAVACAPQVLEFALVTIVPTFVTIDVPSQRSPRAPPAA